MEDVPCFASFALTNIYPLIFNNYFSYLPQKLFSYKISSKHICYNIFTQKYLHRVDVLEKNNKYIFVIFTRTTFVQVTHLKSDEKQATFMNEYLAFRYYAQ